MNPLSSTNHYRVLPSGFLIALRYVTAIYLVFVVLLLIYAWLRSDTFWQLMLFAVLSPLGLLILLIYRLSQRRIVRAKTLRLAEVLDDAANQLEQLPRRIVKYCICRSTSTASETNDNLRRFR